MQMLLCRIRACLVALLIFNIGVIILGAINHSAAILSAGTVNFALVAIMLIPRVPPDA